MTVVLLHTLVFAMMRGMLIVLSLQRQCEFWMPWQFLSAISDHPLRKLCLLQYCIVVPRKPDFVWRSNCTERDLPLRINYYFAWGLLLALCANKLKSFFNVQQSTLFNKKGRKNSKWDSKSLVLTRYPKIHSTPTLSLAKVGIWLLLSAVPWL